MVEHNHFLRNYSSCLKIYTVTKVGQTEFGINAQKIYNKENKDRP